MNSLTLRKPVEVEQDYCIACGCTQFSPCETAIGPCSWDVPPRAGRGMCSRCALHYSAPEAIVRTIREILERRPR